MGSWSIKKTSADAAVTFESLLGIRVLSATGVGMPKMNNVSDNFALTDGAYFQRSVAQVRQFTLVCGIPAETRTSLHTVRKSLIANVSRDRSVTPQPFIIQYTENSVTLEIEAYYDAGMEFNTIKGHSERIPLRFLAVDPFWKTSTATNNTLSFGTSIPSAATTVVTNTGDANAWPTITVTGPGQILQIKNTTTSKTLALGFTLAAGEVVTFDLRPGYKTVTSSVNGNMMAYVPVPGDLATWYLAPGSNNIDTAIDNAGASASISFNATWWSIDGVG